MRKCKSTIPVPFHSKKNHCDNLVTAHLHVFKSFLDKNYFLSHTRLDVIAVMVCLSSVSESCALAFLLGIK